MSRHPEMKGRGQQPRGIGTAGEVVAELAVDEVCHTLGRRGLAHIALLPAVCLHLLLIFHHPEGTVALDILGTKLNDHAAVGPLTATVARAHAVDHYLVRTGGSGNDESSRTHAEGIDTTTVNLGDEGILGGGKILSPTLLVVILYAVDQPGGMFETNTHGKSLCLDFDATVGEIAIDIAGGMSGGKDHRTAEHPLLTTLNTYGLDTHHGVAVKQQTGHAGLVMNLATTS